MPLNIKFGVSCFFLKVTGTRVAFNDSYGTSAASFIMCKCILNPSKYNIRPGKHQKLKAYVI